MESIGSKLQHSDFVPILEAPRPQLLITLLDCRLAKSTLLVDSFEFDKDWMQHFEAILTATCYSSTEHLVAFFQQLFDAVVSSQLVVSFDPVY